MSDKQVEQLENLAEIRSMMERSSRFISLSGLSGVFAGICALIGAAITFWYFDFRLYPFSEMVYDDQGSIRADYLMFLFWVAAGVLVAAVSFGLFFTNRKAKRDGQRIFDNTAQRMLINLGIPLAAGGFFCLVLLWHGAAQLVGSAMLIFYGLALLNASKYTLSDIRYLGIFEIVLGVLAAIITGYALLFWALGFGILHIIYGVMMYNKYEIQS